MGCAALHIASASGAPNDILAKLLGAQIDAIDPFPCTFFGQKTGEGFPDQETASATAIFRGEFCEKSGQLPAKNLSTVSVSVVSVVSVVKPNCDNLTNVRSHPLPQPETYPPPAPPMIANLSLTSLTGRIKLGA